MINWGIRYNWIILRWISNLMLNLWVLCLILREIIIKIIKAKIHLQLKNNKLKYNNNNKLNNKNNENNKNNNRNHIVVQKIAIFLHQCKGYSKNYFKIVL